MWFFKWSQQGLCPFVLWFTPVKYSVVRPESSRNTSCFSLPFSPGSLWSLPSPPVSQSHWGCTFIWQTWGEAWAAHGWRIRLWIYSDSFTSRSHHRPDLWSWANDLASLSFSGSCLSGRDKETRDRVVMETNGWKVLSAMLGTGWERNTW